MSTQGAEEGPGRLVGRTGWRVYPIGLGAMPLSLAGRPREEEALAVMRAFVEGGGDLIDTANVYCRDEHELGHNERLVGGALRRLGVAGRVRVATKGGLTRRGGAWEVDGRPEWLRASCERSLRDLGVDCIDLYQLHAVDPRVPLADSLGELQRLKEEGKIRHIGLSNVRREELVAALAQVEVVSVQNCAHVRCKGDFAQGLAQFCAERGLAYLAHSPVGGHFGHRRLAAEGLLRELAAKYGASPYRIALAWLLAQGEHVLPIPGASRVASITDSLRAPQLRLEAGDLAALAALPDL